MIGTVSSRSGKPAVKYIDEVSDGFIYMVSSASTTGAKSEFGDIQDNYFKRINNLKLKNPQIVGFGISNYVTFSAATTYAKGAIIGSAFIKYIKTNGIQNINKFVETITSK